MNRKPIAAGTFYPKEKKDLLKLMDYLFEKNPKSKKNSEYQKSGIILPHAGYIFSGKAAAKAIEKIKGKPKNIYILGPNHTGLGENISIMDKGEWLTPLGTVPINKTKSDEICKLLGIEPDFKGHIREHSIEVQLPLLQYWFEKDIRIIPIAMKDQTKQTAKTLGEIIKQVASKEDLIVASTDLNHYENQETTIKKDEKIIADIKNLDIEKMYNDITDENISMCGYGPVAVLLNQEFKTVEIIKHTTSGETLDEYDTVVGYLSAILK
ncbi:MAG: AmmeMemoRadiSam system protein B [Thermotogota bacterium]